MKSNLTSNNIIGGFLAICIPIACFFYWQNGANERIFDRHFQHIGNESFLDFRNAENPAAATDRDLQAALKDYEEQHFQTSLSYFAKYLQKTPDDIHAIFLAGMAALETDDSEKAIDYLTVARVNGGAEYYDRATWNLALAYLRAKDTELARILLEELVQDKKSPLVPQAREILTKI